MEKMKMHSLDGTNANIDKIAQLFPDCVTERINEKGFIEKAIDFDVLRQALSHEIIEGPIERYQFTWPDKRNAMLLATSPTTKTLRPVRERSLDFDTTQNVYVEGDNLDVLKIIQETYLHKIDVIYIDPPYNTGNNLIYHNNFYINTSEYIENSGLVDEEGNSLVKNLETNGRFHTDWLNMIYPRLLVARNLLSKTGVLICAIDQSEVNTLGMVLKQVFSDKEVTLVSIVHNPSGTQGLNFSANNEYAYFVYDDTRKSIAFEKRTDETADVRSFMNGAKGSASNYLRVTGYRSFYPIIIKNEQVVGFGDVLDKDVHPYGPNEEMPDGSIYAYPIDADGVERKWLFSRDTVESIKEDLHVKFNERRQCYEVIRIKSEINYKTVWTDKKYNAKTYGTMLLNSMMDNIFSFPKSLYTVEDCIKAAVHDKDNAIILDFFSGSATTAHAVMHLNAQDGGKRRFILVQLPEPVEDKKSKFKTICDIGEERIRKSGKLVLEEMKQAVAEEGLFASQKEDSILDTGFRVLKLDSSNMEDVYYKPEDSSESTLFEDNVKPDRSGEDLLFQVMLECNLPLSAKIQTEKIAGKEVFSVNNGYLIACFDEDVNEEVITAVAKRKPYYFIMRDKSLSSDNVADNFEQIFQAYSKETIRRIL